MYGVILQNLAEYVRKTFSDDEWKQVKKAVKLEEVMMMMCREDKHYFRNYVSSL